MLTWRGAICSRPKPSTISCFLRVDSTCRLPNSAPLQRRSLRRRSLTPEQEEATMAHIMQTPSDSRKAKPAQLDRARQLASTLLSERGEGSGAQIARELLAVLRALDATDRHSFQRHLATEFHPDKAALRSAAERYLADSGAETAAALAQAADPPRQELLRRMNVAPGSTGALIAMRSELTAHLHDEPELKLLDADLRHLFASWFNRGFLELR